MKVQKKTVKTAFLRRKLFAPMLLFVLVTSNVAAVEMKPAKSVSKIPDLKNMVLIPEGTFIMGSNKFEVDKVVGEFGNAKPWYMDEHPQRTVSLPAFYLDHYEVTNLEYADFVKSVNVPPPENWTENGYILSLKPEKLAAASVAVLQKVVSRVLQLDIDSRLMNREELLAAINERLEYMSTLPVTYVTWDNADAYCKWAGKQLPTEEQWEKAARGTQGQEFPWGPEWKNAASNSSNEQWLDGAAPIGSYPLDKSPFGIVDMGGNVTEWVAGWYNAYPGSDFTSEKYGEREKVARGGGWGGEGHYTLHLFYRGAYRVNLESDATYKDVGLRCAKGKE